MEPVVIVFLGCVGLIAFWIGTKVTSRYLYHRQEHLRSMKAMEIELERERRKTAQKWLDTDL